MRGTAAKCRRQLFDVVSTDDWLSSVGRMPARAESSRPHSIITTSTVHVSLPGFSSITLSREISLRLSTCDIMAPGSSDAPRGHHSLLTANPAVHGRPFWHAFPREELLETCTAHTAGLKGWHASLFEPDLSGIVRWSYRRVASSSALI